MYALIQFLRALTFIWPTAQQLFVQACEIPAVSCMRSFEWWSVRLERVQRYDMHIDPSQLRLLISCPSVLWHHLATLDLVGLNRSSPSIMLASVLFRMHWHLCLNSWALELRADLLLPCHNQHNDMPEHR